MEQNSKNDKQGGSQSASAVVQQQQQQQQQQAQSQLQSQSLNYQSATQNLASYASQASSSSPPAAAGAHHKNTAFTHQSQQNAKQTDAQQMAQQAQAQAASGNGNGSGSSGSASAQQQQQQNSTVSAQSYQQQPSQTEVKTIANNFSLAFKEKSIIVTDQSCSVRFEGTKLLDYRGLRVFCLDQSNNPFKMSSDELKEACFPWVYDTQSVSDIDQRKEILYEKLSKKFADFKLFVAVSQRKFSWSYRNAKRGTIFEDVDAYKGYVLILIL